jgi:DNA-binding XRE family transcriptional regulator
MRVRIVNDLAYVKYDEFKLDVGWATPGGVTTPEKRFGDRCRRLRHQAGLSQLDMVRDHGFTLSHYQKLERGALDPRLSTLRRLATAFGVSVSKLVERL